MSDNRNENRETVADIVADIRERAYNATRHGERITDNYAVSELLKSIAANIEAAWKRERAKVEADALAVGGVVEAARQKHVGNAAAMREALVQCELFLGNVSRNGHPMFCFGDQCTACNGVDELRGMVVPALSAPARNCDRFTSIEEARTAYCSECGRMISIWDGNESWLFEEWLFATEAERKGECNGK